MRPRAHGTNQPIFEFVGNVYASHLVRIRLVRYCAVREHVDDLSCTTSCTTVHEARKHQPMTGGRGALEQRELHCRAAATRVCTRHAVGEGRGERARARLRSGVDLNAGSLSPRSAMGWERCRRSPPARAMGAVGVNSSWRGCAPPACRARAPFNEAVGVALAHPRGWLPSPTRRSIGYDRSTGPAEGNLRNTS